jgi:hypothetical protein
MHVLPDGGLEPPLMLLIDRPDHDTLALEGMGWEEG